MPFLMGIQAIHRDKVLDMPLEQVVIVDLDRDARLFEVEDRRGGDSSSKRFDFVFPQDLGGRLRKGESRRRALQIERLYRSQSCVEWRATNRCAPSQRPTSSW